MPCGRKTCAYPDRPKLPHVCRPNATTTPLPTNRRRLRVSDRKLCVRTSLLQNQPVEVSPSTRSRPHSVLVVNASRIQFVCGNVAHPRPLRMVATFVSPNVPRRGVPVACVSKRAYLLRASGRRCARSRAHHALPSRLACQGAAVERDAV